MSGCTVTSLVKYLLIFLAASRLAKADLWILRGVVLLLRALLLVVDGLVC